MIARAAIYDSERGRAWNMTDFRVVMGRVANDGRENYFKKWLQDGLHCNSFELTTLI